MTQGTVSFYDRGKISSLYFLKLLVCPVVDANLYGFVGIFLRGENLSSFPLLLALLSLFSLDVHTSFCWASNMSSGAFEGEKLKAVIDMNTTTFQNTERRGSKLL